ncbi:MAG: IclR family transcriptional regulator [Chloroflexota bacterium]|jgi:DNA-binding IclR family transcriptional regulator
MSTRIRVAERVADILSCFSTEQPELGVLEISDKLNLDQATVCRILLTLKDKGFVSSDPITRKYTIGPKLAQIAQIGIGNTNLRSKALPHMRWLRDQTNETVTLSIRINSQRVCIEQVESKQEIRRIIQVGRPYPLYCGATGKMLLASMPDEEIESYIAQTTFTRFTDTTIVDPDILRAQIRQIRQNGYAIGMGERIPGGSGIAMAVRNYRGDVVAVLSIEQISYRYQPEKTLEYLADLKIATDRISADLGYSSSQ